MIKLLQLTLKSAAVMSAVLVGSLMALPTMTHMPSRVMAAICIGFSGLFASVGYISSLYLLFACIGEQRRGRGRDSKMGKIGY